MKRVIYVLSAAALLTVGIIACSKEQAIQNTSVAKLENKNGRPDGAGQEGKMMELALPTEIRNMNLEKSPDLGIITAEHPVSAVDANGNIAEGVIKITMNPASGKVSRIEITESVAKLKGIKRGDLINVGIGDDVIEQISAKGGCLGKCENDFSKAYKDCGADDGCRTNAEAAFRSCKTTCWLKFGLGLGALLVGLFLG
jgi:hypothetical protein